METVVGTFPHGLKEGDVLSDGEGGVYLVKAITATTFVCIPCPWYKRLWLELKATVREFYWTLHMKAEDYYDAVKVWLKS